MPSPHDPYPLDLTDDEWEVVAPLFSKSEHRGRKPTHDLRRVLDGCFYVLRGGIAWRMTPHDLPQWRVVYDHFSQWRKTGKWERINETLPERYRVSRGRDHRQPQPRPDHRHRPRQIHLRPGHRRGGADGAGTAGPQRRSVRRHHPGRARFLVAGRPDAGLEHRCRLLRRISYRGRAAGAAGVRTGAQDPVRCRRRFGDHRIRLHRRACQRWGDVHLLPGGMSIFLQNWARSCWPPRRSAPLTWKGGH